MNSNFEEYDVTYTEEEINKCVDILVEGMKVEPVSNGYISVDRDDRQRRMQQVFIYLLDQYALLIKNHSAETSLEIVIALSDVITEGANRRIGGQCYVNNLFIVEFGWHHSYDATDEDRRVIPDHIPINLIDEFENTVYPTRYWQDNIKKIRAMRAMAAEAESPVIHTIEEIEAGQVDIREEVDRIGNVFMDAIVNVKSLPDDYVDYACFIVHSPKDADHNILPEAIEKYRADREYYSRQAKARMGL